MTTRLVVSDTSPIRVRSHLSHLPLLAESFDEVLIPPPVPHELETPESRALGIIGLLVRAKQKGLVENVVPLVLKARDEMNFFISDIVIDEVRRLVCE